MSVGCAVIIASVALRATSLQVVVDFYNAACGACKYILPQFVKLCKGESGSREGVDVGVRFLKHDVRDEYDDVSEIARFYKVKAVPMFAFFIGGSRVQQFATRDRTSLSSAISNLRSRMELK
eukprot:TRINITY_DN2290_c1_g2_i4.p1 TRINITY_DN2290_c1_g2~~TRINITY_DN2290_c1_g2_i4.p1  ORF type:complete len:122 (-),score=27.66 TRINITY_DN2290_c1_g2_i4:237-602(-)